MHNLEPSIMSSIFTQTATTSDKQLSRNSITTNYNLGHSRKNLQRRMKIKLSNKYTHSKDK